MADVKHIQRMNSTRTTTGAVSGGIRRRSRVSSKPSIVPIAIVNATGKSTAKPHASRCGFITLTQVHASTPTYGWAIA